jgi:hypothetical protein
MAKAKQYEAIREKIKACTDKDVKTGKNYLFDYAGQKNV